MPGQLLPEYRLSLRGASKFEQGAAKRLARRVAPDGRLVVRDGVLDGNRLVEMPDGCFAITLRQRDLPGQERDRHPEHPAHAVGEVREWDLWHRLLRHGRGRPEL